MKDFDFCYMSSIFLIYAWVVPLEDKKGITYTNAFQKILDEFNHKPNKIWAYQGSDFYNRSVDQVVVAG